MDENKVDATMTVDQAHAEIGTSNISRGALYNAIARKEIPHIRLGRRILIPRHAFNTWIKNAGAAGDQRPAA